MERSAYATVRPFLESAIQAIEFFLSALQDDKALRHEMVLLYEQLEKETDAGTKNAGGLYRPTETELFALCHGTDPNGIPLGDEKRESVLSEWPCSQPTNDCDAPNDWQKSVRLAAAWLREAGETVASNGINVQLDLLVAGLSDTNSQADYAARRREAEHIKEILAACLDRNAMPSTTESAERSPGVASTSPAAKMEHGEGNDGADLTPKKARSTKTPTIPKLSERQYNILQAMLELDATAVQNRTTTEKIAVKAEGTGISPEQFKRPMSDLKRRKLVDSQDGRDGGSWLTNKGLAVAELLKNTGNTKR